MIEWTGNLEDDCCAMWGGLFLHVEEMDRNLWWWAVYDAEDEIIDTSNNYEKKFKNGKDTRLAAEIAAKTYVGI
ncbi:hypothetical protein [Microbulbifer pacificus]|uniref:Uncharacterized protein n=1 Tax=Microbulbifer pacificus TaxID=407164 RepID=A0AAU0MXK8_9GAMM|nr:hypothetical protein [Microbulbifer pacificus]WOX04935.1 hypothetical protein R5R33_14485 [Microbulbifer pacificus]